MSQLIARSYTLIITARNILGVSGGICGGGARGGGCLIVISRVIEICTAGVASLVNLPNYT